MERSFCLTMKIRRDGTATSPMCSRNISKTDKTFLCKRGRHYGIVNTEKSCGSGYSHSEFHRRATHRQLCNCQYVQSCMAEQQQQQRGSVLIESADLRTDPVNLGLPCH